MLPRHCACRLLSGRAELPAEPEMEAAVAAHYKWLQEVGRPLRYCHMMDEVGGQWAEGLPAGATTRHRCMTGTL